MSLYERGIANIGGEIQDIADAFKHLSDDDETPKQKADREIAASHRRTAIGVIAILGLALAIDLKRRK